MEQSNDTDYLRKEELIYWIDKWFVQETAQARIGRRLTDDELENFKKLVEFGLWHAVFETIKIAIDEVAEKQI